jgi:hypothetical protein
MIDIRISSPIDFAIVIDKLILDQKANTPSGVLSKIEEFAILCFNEGFKAGKLQENKPIL